MAQSTGFGSWSNITLTKDETWFVVGGTLRVYCLGGNVPGDDDGADLPEGQSFGFRSGQTVYYREGRHRNSAGSFERVEVST